MARESTAERAMIETQRVEKVYGVLARVYDEFFDWALGPGRRRAVANLSLGAGDRVLEVGVGTGLSLPDYPPDCHVTGVDISAAMLGRARQRTEELGIANADLRLMDARDLAFPDASFDHVIAPYVVSVVPEPEKVLAEMCRVCRPGGTIIVVNHFGSMNPVMSRLESMLSPLTSWVGFRLDLPVATVTGMPGARLRRQERVNLFGLWKLLELERVP